MRSCTSRAVAARLYVFEPWRSKISPHTGISREPCAATIVVPSIVAKTRFSGKTPPLRRESRVRSAGLILKTDAAGPSPRPLRPWHEAQRKTYSSLPESTKDCGDGVASDADACAFASCSCAANVASVTATMVAAPSKTRTLRARGRRSLRISGFPMRSICNLVKSHSWSGTRSSAASQVTASLSDGARQSPRGESDPPDPTLGALGIALRLN